MSFKHYPSKPAQDIFPLCTSYFQLQSCPKSNITGTTGDGFRLKTKFHGTDFGNDKATKRNSVRKKIRSFLSFIVTNALGAILRLPRETSNRRFSKNTPTHPPTHPQKRPVVQAIICIRILPLYDFFFFRSCLMELTDSKVHFKHLLYMPAECWKSRGNLWKRLRSLICALLIVWVKV